METNNTIILATYTGDGRMTTLVEGGAGGKLLCLEALCEAVGDNIGIPGGETGVGFDWVVDTIKEAHKEHGRLNVKTEEGGKEWQILKN